MTKCIFFENNPDNIEAEALIDSVESGVSEYLVVTVGLKTLNAEPALLHITAQSKQCPSSSVAATGPVSCCFR